METQKQQVCSRTRTLLVRERFYFQLSAVSAALWCSISQFTGFQSSFCISVLFVLSPSFSPVQFSLVAQSCPTLCDPMNRSTPGLPVHHQLPEFSQTHVHQVSDAIQPSYHLSSPSPPALNPSQHQSLFQWVNSFSWGGQSTGVSALASFLPKRVGDG